MANKLTELLKLLRLCTVIVYAAVPPCVTVRAEGVAEIVKSGVGARLTVRLMLVLLVIPPLRPSTVIVKVPVGVEPLVMMLSVEPLEPLEAGVTVGGVNPVPGKT